MSVEKPVDPVLAEPGEFKFSDMAPITMNVVFCPGGKTMLTLTPDALIWGDDVKVDELAAELKRCYDRSCGPK